jgi:histone H3/H4
MAPTQPTPKSTPSATTAAALASAAKAAMSTPKPATSATGKKSSKPTTSRSTAKKSKPRPKKKSTSSKHKVGANASTLSGNHPYSSSAHTSSASSAAGLLKKAKSLYETIQMEKDATFHDVAWLSTIPSYKQNHPLNTTSPSFLENDLNIVQSALQKNRLKPKDVTSQAFGCLLESARKYALEIIYDAMDYSMLSSKEEITSDDLEYAREMKLENVQYHTKTAEELEIMTQIADKTNRIILPTIPNNCYNGIILPPPEHNLLGRTFDVVSRSAIIESGTGGEAITSANEDNNNRNLQQQRITSSDGTIQINSNAGGVEGKINDCTTLQSSASSTPSHGATRGPQIEIKLQSKMSP